jgi:hypothetical protein
MQIGEEIEMSIGDFFDLCDDEGRYQIETPDGWKDIGFVIKKQQKMCYELILDGVSISCSSDHYLMTSNGWKSAEDVNVKNDDIQTRDGLVRVLDKKFLGSRDTIDLEVLSDSHSYYSNGIVSHNTGKSLTCRVLPTIYNMPLLRLDWGSLFGKYVGESEYNLRRSLMTAESVSPCILWIDEIEKGVSGTESSGSCDGGTTSRVFGTMLTWMSEKEHPVFIVATANNVMGIPPEFMRAGRFDEIFFLDLPDDDQRWDVTKKLIQKKKRDPKTIDINTVVLNSEYYTPAEIEKGIDNALIMAFQDGKRELRTEDIVQQLKAFSPLYNSRREDIERIRIWALGKDGKGGRAVKVCGKKKNGDNDIGQVTDAIQEATLDMDNLLI